VRADQPEVEALRLKAHLLVPLDGVPTTHIPARRRCVSMREFFTSA